MSKRAILIGGPKDGMKLLVSNPEESTTITVPAFKGVQGADQCDEYTHCTDGLYNAEYSQNRDMQKLGRPNIRLRFYHETLKVAFLPVPKQ